MPCGRVLGVSRADFSKAIGQTFLFYKSSYQDNRQRAGEILLHMGKFSQVYPDVLHTDLRFWAAYLY